MRLAVLIFTTLFILIGIHAHSQQNLLQDHLKALQTEVQRAANLPLEEKLARQDFLFRLSFKAHRAHASLNQPRQITQLIQEISRDSALESTPRMVSFAKDIADLLTNYLEPQQDIFEFLKTYLTTNQTEIESTAKFEDQDYINKFSFLKAKELDLDLAGETAFGKLNPAFDSAFISAIFSYKFEIPTN
jgi:hypothetical protein